MTVHDVLAVPEYVLFSAVAPQLSLSAVALAFSESESAEFESPHGRLVVGFTYTGINPIDLSRLISMTAGMDASH
jgi:hypothetical protein